MTKDTITQEQYDRLLSEALVAIKPTKRVSLNELLSGELGNVLANKIYNDGWTYEDVSDWLAERLGCVDFGKIKDALKARLKITGATVLDKPKKHQDERFVVCTCPNCLESNDSLSVTNILRNDGHWLEFDFHCYNCGKIYKVLMKP